MSLEYIDRILASWEDPEYEGIIEQLTFHKYIESSLDTDINKKLIKDVEQIRFLRPSVLKMSEYSKDKKGLIEFYKDHNFVQTHPRNVVNAYRMMSFPDQAELDAINKYIREDTKFIMEVGFGEGLRALNFLENSNANLITFSDFKQEYSFYGKMFLENMYSNRHIIIFGLTKNSIPNFSLDKEPHIKFDLIHYSNSRKYYEIYEEILNCVKYTSEKTILIIDNVCPHIPAGTGPYVAMNKLIKDGVVSFVEHIKIPGAYGDYSSGIAILKFNKYSENDTTGKLPLDVYKSIEIKLPLYEFTNYLIDNFKNDHHIDVDVIKLYLNRLTKAGVELDDVIKKYLKEYYEIEV